MRDMAKVPVPDSLKHLDTESLMIATGAQRARTPRERQLRADYVRYGRATGKMRKKRVRATELPSVDDIVMQTLRQRGGSR